MKATPFNLKDISQYVFFFNFFIINSVVLKINFCTSPLWPIQVFHFPLCILKLLSYIYMKDTEGKTLDVMDTGDALKL